MWLPSDLRIWSKTCSSCRRYCALLPLSHISSLTVCTPAQLIRSPRLGTRKRCCADERPFAQEVKQKGEYSFGLTSQVEARTREAQVHEKAAKEAQSEALRLSRELEDTQVKAQVSPSHHMLDEVPDGHKSALFDSTLKHIEPHRSLSLFARCKLGTDGFQRIGQRRAQLVLHYTARARQTHLQSCLRLQGLETDVGKLTSNLKAMDAQIASLKTGHSKQQAETDGELQAAQRQLSGQQTKLDEFQAMLHSEHVNANNWKATMESLQSKLKTRCGCDHYLRRGRRLVTSSN